MQVWIYLWVSTLPMQCPSVAALAIEFYSPLNVAACRGIEKTLRMKLQARLNAGIQNFTEEAFKSTRVI